MRIWDPQAGGIVCAGEAAGSPPGRESRDSRWFGNLPAVPKHGPASEPSWLRIVPFSTLGTSCCSLLNFEVSAENSRVFRGFPWM